ncbi:hypothetical protein CBR_g54980 [Chara braunii]|uniref:Uncharacterized protein n=1 Tax=Chara braunii TaxID=69332 RepID=A0A388K7J2_CHABU|nr:hypothetical protein CBR_g54980 [Chara braunii]|eukprot:GBG66001.1 hypothetical protein CBR_g54980 [Chara braunii]
MLCMATVRDLVPEEPQLSQDLDVWLDILLKRKEGRRVRGLCAAEHRRVLVVEKDGMSSSKGEVEPTGTSGKESRKDSTRRSSTATQGWSNHSRSKWFIEWCYEDASYPTAQPCGPVIFIDDSRRRRVLGVVLRWEDAKGGRRHFYMQKVYGAKGNVVANSKGTLLDLELCEGFGAGAVNTPFYRELVLGGCFVLAREFFDMLEDKNIALDVPCDVNPSLELSLPLKLCSGCESSGAAAEGGDLGSGPATQLHRGESRGQFDDSEDEGTAPPLSDTRRSVLSIPGVQTDAPVQRKSTGPAVQVAAYSEVDLEASEGQGVEEVDAGGLGSQGAPKKRRGDRPDEFAGSTKKLKSKAPRTAWEKRKGTEGEQGRQVAKRPSSRQKQLESGLSSPPTTGTPIIVDAGYFLEYKDGVRTKREFDISPAQIVDLGDWEDLYNQRSLDPVLVEGIKEAMRLAFENKAQSYDLPTLKLAPLGLDKPTPGTKAERLRPEDWRDELAGQYYYYAVCGQHNAAAARSLLGSEVARKYNFERWPARMVYFSDDDFEGYFLVSSQDNKKDLKAPPRQLKLSMRDIRWQWKRAGCPRAVMGNPIGKQDQVRKWREFCNIALNMTSHNNLWILADQQGEEAIKKQGAALRNYFPLAVAGENVWKLDWIMRKKKVKNVKPGVAYIHNDKLGRKEVVYNVPVDPPTKKGKKEKEEGEWFMQVPEPDAHCWKTMESLTDNKKCRVLKKVLACEVVWVQAGSAALAKLSVQEVVNLVKCDRVLVRLWNYYQFKHDKRPDADWSQRFPFLKSRSAILRQFESRGLDAELWDGSTKYVTESSLFKDCPPYMGCDDDRSIEATEKLAVPLLVESEKELTFGSYSSLISTEDEETTGIDFDVTADEEGSNTESLDLQYDQHFTQHAIGSSLAGPSTSLASLVSPMAKPAPGTTPMKLLQRMQALASGHRSMRPGSDIPPDHLSWTNANIHFLPEPQSRSTEADWGHDMIWHPGVIQPAIQKGEWILAVAVPDGGWMPLPRGSKSDFLDVTRIAVLQKARAENGSFAPEDVSVISTVGRLFAELQDKCWLELTEDYYNLDTSPLKGRVDWKTPPPSGTHVCTGSWGPDGGENEGDEAGGGKRVPGRQHEGDEAEGGSRGDTTTAEGSGGVAGEALGRQQSTGPGLECSAQSENMPSSSACSVMAALVALRAGSVKTFKSIGIRTSMLAERTERTDAQSWSGPGVASHHPKIDSGAVRDGTSPSAGDRQPLRSEREGACGGPGDRETVKFAGIRTSPGKACGGPDDRETAKFAGI